MKKEIIKQAAFELFAERGYDSTSMRDIAKKVGIKAPSIYAHYESKEEIFNAIFNEVLGQHIQEIKELVLIGKTSPKNHELLYSVFVKALKFFSNSNIAAFWGRTIFSSNDFMIETLNTSTTQMREGIFSLYSEVFKETLIVDEISEEDLRTMIISFLAIIHGYIIMSHLHNIDLDDEQIERAWELYLNGISKKCLNYK